ncbi:MAG: hypothetical protein JRN53_06780 [Nitrososphaerota archaeon]|nr:hypothetical protein [Nitrososphaerota archaeon]
MPSGVRKRRKGVSRTTAAFAVVIIIIIIGVGIFMLLSAGGLANIGIGGNGNSTTNNQIWAITLNTTNTALAKSIDVGPVFNPATPPLILQPNVNYTFQVTIVELNTNLKPIQPQQPITVGGGVSSPNISNTAPITFLINQRPATQYFVTPPFNVTMMIMVAPNANGYLIISGSINNEVITWGVMIHVESAS